MPYQSDAAIFLQAKLSLIFSKTYRIDFQCPLFRWTNRIWILGRNSWNQCTNQRNGKGRKNINLWKCTIPDCTKPAFSAMIISMIPAIRMFMEILLTAGLVVLLVKSI